MKKIKLLIFTLLAIFSLNFNLMALDTDKAAPDFTLPAVKNKTITLSDYKGKFVVLEWTNYECPFVKKHYGSNNMQSLQKEYTGKGVVWISICSSAKDKQGYFSREQWVKMIEAKKSMATDVALDYDGKVGKLYGAKTTPHIFIVDPKGTLIYQGAIDDKASFDPADIPSAKNYVKETLNAALAGKPVSEKTTSSYGCSVKY